MLNSDDGISWTAQDSGLITNLLSVAYGQGGFVAVGEGGAIVKSVDAIVWKTQTSGVSADLTGVTYGGGGYLAVGWPGIYEARPGQVVLTSSDGINWIARTVVSPKHTYSLTSSPGCAFINGRFFIFGSLGAILVSDALTGQQLSLKMRPVGGSFVLTISAPTGSSFRLQGCSDLSSDNWSEIETFTNVSALTQWTDPVNNHSRRFYRVVAP